MGRNTATEDEVQTILALFGPALTSHPDAGQAGAGSGGHAGSAEGGQAGAGQGGERRRRHDT